MKSYLFESITPDKRTPINWGKFMVLVPDDVEWSWQSKVVASMEPILGVFGWTRAHVIVMDIEAGEAAIFTPGNGQYKAELENHRIWHCPQFGPFIEWLDAQDIAHLWQSPGVVELEDVTFLMRGWREIGPHPVTLTLHDGDVITMKWGGKLHSVIVEGCDADGARIRSLSVDESMELAAVELAGGAEVTELERPDGQVLMTAAALPGITPGRHGKPGETAETLIIPAVPADDATAVMPAANGEGPGVGKDDDDEPAA